LDVTYHLSAFHVKLEFPQSQVSVHRTGPNWQRHAAAVVSRLENGKQDNPTVVTLMRYAAAIGKRFLWSYEDLEITDTATRAGKRRTVARRLGSL
jgi:hypothetical protein